MNCVKKEFAREEALLGVANVTMVVLLLHFLSIDNSEQGWVLFCLLELIEFSRVPKFPDDCLDLFLVDCVQLLLEPLQIKLLNGVPLLHWDTHFASARRYEQHLVELLIVKILVGE